jgi:hypothetical protein
MPIISPTAISPHNRRGINWSSYWTQLLTEGEDNLVTEADEIIMTEQNIE